MLTLIVGWRLSLSMIVGSRFRRSATTAFWFTSSALAPGNGDGVQGKRVSEAIVAENVPGRLNLLRRAIALPIVQLARWPALSECSGTTHRFMAATVPGLAHASLATYGAPAVPGTPCRPCLRSRTQDRASPALGMVPRLSSPSIWRK